MQFIPILQNENETAQKIFQSYTTTFPPEERRETEQFLDLFNNSNTQITSILVNKKEIGYLILWHFSEFVFIEHFEVFSEYRNQKFGQKILEKLKEIYPHLVLEAEPEHLNEIAKRRINFYQRCGFSIINKNYIQPSYGAGKESINLYLLANFIPKKNDELQKEIHQKVYGVDLSL